MQIARKQQKPVSKQSMPKKRSLYNVTPWICVHHTDRSEIKAHVEYTGQQEVIAIIAKAKGINAEALAEFITRLINEHENNQNQMREAIAALELCLESDGLSWEAEQAADVIIRRAAQKN
jgi:hypothetical protein